MQMTHWNLPSLTIFCSFGGWGVGGAGTASSEPSRSMISSIPFLSSSESPKSGNGSSSGRSLFKPCCFFAVLVRLAPDDCCAGWDVEEEEVSCRVTRRCFLAGRASGAGEGLPKRSSESGITIWGMGSWRERFLEEREEDSEGMIVLEATGSCRVWILAEVVVRLWKGLPGWLVGQELDCRYSGSLVGERVIVGCGLAVALRLVSRLREVVQSVNRMGYRRMQKATVRMEVNR